MLLSVEGSRNVNNVRGEKTAKVCSDDWRKMLLDVSSLNHRKWHRKHNQHDNENVWERWHASCCLNPGTQNLCSSNQIKRLKSSCPTKCNVCFTHPAAELRLILFLHWKSNTVGEVVLLLKFPQIFFLFTFTFCPVHSKPVQVWRLCWLSFLPANFSLQYCLHSPNSCSTALS